MARKARKEARRKRQTEKKASKARRLSRNKIGRARSAHEGVALSKGADSFRSGNTLNFKVPDMPDVRMHVIHS